MQLQCSKVMVYSNQYISKLLFYSLVTLSLAPHNVGWVDRKGDHRSGVDSGKLRALRDSPLEVLNVTRHEGGELAVGELLTNAPVSTTSKWKVRGGNTLGDGTKAIINSLPSLSLSLGLGHLLGRGHPSTRIKLLGVREVSLGLLGVTRGGHDEMALGHDERSARNGQISHDLSEDGVNRHM